MLEIVLGVLAIAGLLGWTLTLGLLTRAMVPMANALKVCQQIVDREDEKVFSLAKRALEKQNRTPQPPVNTRPADEPPATNPMGLIFGGSGTGLIDEQPDSSEQLEVVG